VTGVAEAVAAGDLGGRVWLYSNYHCNLACTYCLTESSPSSARKALSPETMSRLAREAADLGFTDLGITGGEPLLLPSLPSTLVELATVLPTLVLTNATLFGDHRLAALAPLVGLPVSFQISLDAPDPDPNDELRGPGNFAKVVEAIPRLLERGFGVRIATTVGDGRLSEDDHARLCELHRSLGVSDEDHVVRPIIARGRAEDNGLGQRFTSDEIPAELTVTVDGAFWSPFGPTMRDGRIDTDLLVTRVTDPLAKPAEALVRLVQGRPAGADARLGIR